MDFRRCETFTSTFRRFQADHSDEMYERHFAPFVAKELTDNKTDEATNEATDEAISSPTEVYAEFVYNIILKIANQYGTDTMEYLIEKMVS